MEANGSVLKALSTVYKYHGIFSFPFPFSLSVCRQWRDTQIISTIIMKTIKLDIDIRLRLVQ